MKYVELSLFIKDIIHFHTELTDWVKRRLSSCDDSLVAKRSLGPWHGAPASRVQQEVRGND